MERNRPSQRNRQQSGPRCGFTVLELLTVMSLITMVLGVALPAIGSAREAARKISCVNNLKQIGVALHSYHDVYHCLPAGWQSELTEQSAYGWAVPLLPFLEQSAVYHGVDRNCVVEDSVQSSAALTSLPVYLCPSDIYEPQFTLFEDDGVVENASLVGSLVPLVDLPTASYVAVFGTIEPDDVVPAPHGDGAFPGVRCQRFASFSRGLSNMLFIGERTMGRIPSTWLGIDFRGEDATCRLVGVALEGPNCQACDECEFGSRHPGGANFLWGDGRVQFVADDIDMHMYQTLSQRDLMFSSSVGAPGP